MSDERGDVTSEERSVATADIPQDAGRKVCFIVGSGRSGTSTLACTLQALGLRVPQPEVPADHTNPRGFGESQWVVNFHDRLLRRANVAVADSRPQAWFDTGKLSTNEKIRERVRAWLDSQFTEDAEELVLKDPRLSWFIGLWRSASVRVGAVPSFAVVLRPPAEVVASKQAYYSPHVTEASRAASWVNHLLHTERATRGSQRAFLRYHDLLDDWTLPVYRLGEQFALSSVTSASAAELRQVHAFIDPSLHRIRATWEDLSLPRQLQVLVDETWQELDRLVDPAQDDAAAHARFDELRREYTQFYEDAESVSASTALAARRSGRIEAAAESAAEQAREPEPAREEVDSAPRRKRMRGMLGRSGEE